MRRETHFDLLIFFQYRNRKILVYRTSVAVILYVTTPMAKYRAHVCLSSTAHHRIVVQNVLSMLNVINRKVA